MKELYIINLFQDKNYAMRNSEVVLVRTVPAASSEVASKIVSNHLEIEVTVNDARKQYGAGEFFATVDKFDVTENGDDVTFKKVPKRR